MLGLNEFVTSWIEFLVWVMHQHVKMPNLDPNIPLPYTFVTILVDKISFTDLVPKVNCREFIFSIC